MGRGRALGALTVAVAGCGLLGCSSGSAGQPKPKVAAPSTTTSLPAGTGGHPGTPQQTVLAWFAAVNAKDQAAVTFLAEPYRGDWARTRTTVWPRFTNLDCQPRSQTDTEAMVHCTFSETRYAGEGNPPAAWNFQLTATPGGTWLITHYGAV